MKALDDAGQRLRGHRADSHATLASPSRQPRSTARLRLSACACTRATTDRSAPAPATRRPARHLRHADRGSSRSWLHTSCRPRPFVDADGKRGYISATGARTGGARVERRRKRHLHHVVAGAVAALACARFTFGPGKLACASERSADTTTRSRAPCKGRSGVPSNSHAYEGITESVTTERGAKRCAKCQSSVLHRSRARQVRPDPPCAPEVREIESRLPRQRRRTESPHVGVDEPNLLRVTVGAPFATVDRAAALFTDRQPERPFRRHRAHLPIEHTTGPHAQQGDRHDEERNACDRATTYAMRSARPALARHAGSPARFSSGRSCHERDRHQPRRRHRAAPHREDRSSGRRGARRSRR